MTLFSFLRLCALFLLPVAPIATCFAQQASVNWLPPVKSEKNERTLAILSAGADGYLLLRQRAAAFQLVSLSSEGNLVSTVPVLDGKTSVGFLFAVSSTDMLLLVYLRGAEIVMRRYDTVKFGWKEPARALFPAEGDGSNVWYAVSENGEHTAIYQLDRSGVFHAVVLDRHFNLEWGKTQPLPEKDVPVWFDAFLCSNKGEIWATARVFDPAMKAGTGIPPAPKAWLAGGRPLYLMEPVTVKLPAHALNLLRLSAEKPAFESFFPATKHKYVCSTGMSEDSLGRIWLSGLLGNTDSEQIESYFLYRVDPVTGKTETIKNSALGSNVRKAFLNEKAVENKAPVKGLKIRRIDWSADGFLWQMVEQENPAAGTLGNGALLRFDSTGRINAVRVIEKQQFIGGKTGQNFSGMVMIRGKTQGWSTFWNNGSWPGTLLANNVCKNTGSMAQFEVFEAFSAKVSFVPHTLRSINGRWYFVGESEYGEQYRVGSLNFEH